MMFRGDQTSVLLLILASNVLCDDLFQMNRRDDPCVAFCEKLSQIYPHESFVELLCQRGCRFADFPDSRYDLLVNNLNNSKEACESLCSEAYTLPKSRTICESGCNFMAARRIEDLAKLVVADIANADNLLMALEVPENDAMTDPDLRKELLPGWDKELFKLPHTIVKSVAKDSDTLADYGDSSFLRGGGSIYYGEIKETTNNSYWLQCGSRHATVPGWLVHSAAVLVIVTGLWLRIMAKRCIKEEQTLNTTSAGDSNKLIILIPDEAPLHKTPPPKYNEIANLDDVDFKQ